MVPGPRVVPDRLAIWNDLPSREVAPDVILVKLDSVIFATPSSRFFALGQARHYRFPVCLSSPDATTLSRARQRAFCLLRFEAL